MKSDDLFKIFFVFDVIGIIIQISWLFYLLEG